MPDPANNYRALVHFSRAVRAGQDVHAVFRQAAEEIHRLTGCRRVALYFGANASAACPNLMAEFRAAADSCELSTPRTEPAEVAWVFRHRQACSTECPAALYLPLLCRADVVGVLEVAGHDEDAPGQWDLAFLEELAGLLALALDGLAARAGARESQRYRQEMTYLRDEIKTERDLRVLAGESQAMKAVRLAVQQVARTDSTVLILGETGTGKELVARAIHQLSPRREHLLVAVNCAALAPGVVASELFGHEQGAFTGATRRRLGRFELAQRGTVFLDEVGELSLETQVLLLRVLQERVLERVGGGEPVAVDVRLIAATHQDLTAAMTQGRFRADLFFRLNVFPIPVPPLRERHEDIPDLVRYFLHHLGRRMNSTVTRVSPETLRLLTGYAWPGNVRELENLVERALIVSTGDTLEVNPTWLRPVTEGDAVGSPSSLAELERRTILETLERCRGKIYGTGGAAAALGLKPTTLYGKMRKHRIGKTGPN